jgi:hypothetical protein
MTRLNLFALLLLSLSPSLAEAQGGALGEAPRTSTEARYSANHFPPTYLMTYKEIGNYGLSSVPFRAQRLLERKIKGRVLMWAFRRTRGSELGRYAIFWKKRYVVYSGYALAVFETERKSSLVPTGSVRVDPRSSVVVSVRAVQRADERVLAERKIRLSLGEFNHCLASEQPARLMVGVWRDLAKTLGRDQDDSRIAIRMVLTQADYLPFGANARTKRTLDHPFQRERSWDYAIGRKWELPFCLVRLANGDFSWGGQRSRYTYPPFSAKGHALLERVLEVLLEAGDRISPELWTWVQKARLAKQLSALDWKRLELIAGGEFNTLRVEKALQKEGRWLQSEIRDWKLSQAAPAKGQTPVTDKRLAAAASYALVRKEAHARGISADSLQVALARQGKAWSAYQRETLGKLSEFERDFARALGRLVQEAPSESVAKLRVAKLKRKLADAQEELTESLRKTWKAPELGSLKFGSPQEVARLSEALRKQLSSHPLTFRDQQIALLKQLEEELASASKPARLQAVRQARLGAEQERASFAKRLGLETRSAKGASQVLEGNR